MKKLRCAVIGLGMGRGHVRGYREHPQCEVVAVADIDKKKLEEYQKAEQIPEVFTDPVKMLKKVKPDLVSIVVPNKFHLPLTLAALEHGCHVLCEKPMALNAAEAQIMEVTAEKAGLRLAVNFSSRFSPQAFAMKKLVDEGTLGDVYFARSIWQRRRGMPGFGGWFGTKALSGGGPLIDLGVHRLDLALWLMNYPEPQWVIGSTYNKIAAPIAAREKKNFDVEDFACAMIKFKNGATLELEASWAGNIKPNEMMSTRLLGTQGGLYQFNPDGNYEFQLEAYVERGGCQYDMKLHPPVPESHSSYYSFADAIINNKPFSVSAREGVVVMQLLDAIYESSATGRPVELP